MDAGRKVLDSYHLHDVKSSKYNQVVVEGWWSGAGSKESHEHPRNCSYKEKIDFTTNHRIQRTFSLLDRGRSAGGRHLEFSS